MSLTETTSLMNILREIELTAAAVVPVEVAPISEEITADYERQIDDFLSSLTADDVGKDIIGPYTIHYEGFSEWCQQDAQDRCHLPKDDPRHLNSYEDVYEEVLQDFVNREQGNFPIDYGLTGDEDYPVFYAIFADESVTETASTGQGGGSAGIGGGQMVGGPTTYEQEYGMFKSKGPRRITAMTNETLDSSYPSDGNTITLNQLYQQERPDDNEAIWNYVGDRDFDVPFSIETISPSELLRP